MVHMTCPWCEVELPFGDAAVEQTCPECRTTWSYEDETNQSVIEYALAA